MSVAAMNAAALAGELAHGAEPDPYRYFQAVDRILEAPWRLAVGADLAFFVSSRRRHTSSLRDWSSNVCSSDLVRSMIGQEFSGPGDDLLKFAPGNYSTFDRTLLVHSAGSALRAHWVFFALAIHRSEPRSEERRVGKGGGARGDGVGAVGSGCVW